MIGYPLRAGRRPAGPPARRVCAFDWHYVIPFDPTRGFQFEADFTLGRRDRTDITYSGV